MKTLISILSIIFLSISSIFAQSVAIDKSNFEAIRKQINDSLPMGWSLTVNPLDSNELVIQSQVIELNPDMTSNDPANLKGKCEIFIKIVPKVSKDSISIVRKQNQMLKQNLPPQNSKDNLRNWNLKNQKTLLILDAEPTNYDTKFSYRIKCRRIPKTQTDLTKYKRIMDFLNQRFTLYGE